MSTDPKDDNKDISPDDMESARNIIDKLSVDESLFLLSTTLDNSPTRNSPRSSIIESQVDCCGDFTKVPRSNHSFYYRNRYLCSIQQKISSTGKQPDGRKNTSSRKSVSPEDGTGLYRSEDS